MKIFEFNAPFRKFLPLFIIMIGIIVFMGKSYSLVLLKYQNNKESVLELEYDSNQELTIVDTKPLSSGAITFKVKNNTEKTLKYSLLLKDLSNNLSFKNYLNFSYKVNENDYSDLKSFKDSNYIVKDNYIESKKEVTYQVKVSLTKDLPNEYLNKTFNSKIILVTE